MNIKDLAPGSYTVVQPKKMNINDLDPSSYEVVNQIPTEQPGLTTSSNPIGSLPVIKQATQLGVGLGTNIAKGGLSLGQTFLKGADIVSRGLGLGSQYKPAIKAMEDIKQKVFIDPFKNEIESGFGKTGEVVGEVAQYLAPSSLVTKGQKAITTAVNKIPAVSKIAQFGRGALGVTGRASIEALGAGFTGLTKSGGDIKKAKQDALLGGGFSAGFGALGALARGAKESGLAKNILSKTSGIPKTAFQEAEKVGVNKFATPEKALANTRGAVINLRAKNTAMWQDELPKIADEYNGVRKGLNDNQIMKLAKIADEFGLDETLVPQNLKNMSAVESMNLMKGLNELDSMAVKVSPKGVIVRQFKKELRSDILDSFGGEEGKIGQLWKNYAIKSEIFNNANDLVKAYKTNPISTVTAKNRLMAIFDENKPEFLKAIKELESEMGVNLTGDIASTKFQNIFPKGILKADGGLPTRAGIIDKFINGLLLPFTSPKLVGKMALPAKKEAGIIGKRVFGNYQLPENKNMKAINQTKTIIPNTVSKNPISTPTLPQPPKTGKTTLPKGKVTAPQPTIAPKVENTPRGTSGKVIGKEEYAKELASKRGIVVENNDPILDNFIFDNVNQKTETLRALDSYNNYVRKELPEGNILTKIEGSYGVVLRDNIEDITKAKKQLLLDNKAVGKTKVTLPKNK